MRMNMYLNGVKVSKTYVKDLIGETLYNKMLSRAKDRFWKDPGTENRFRVGANHLRVEFYG